MALDKDILGTALYTVRQSYVNRDYNSLIAQYGNLNAARLAQAKDEAEVFIDHIKNFAQINATVGIGLTASTFPVEGLSTVNIIE
jgi:hypothetical protein